MPSAAPLKKNVTGVGQQSQTSPSSTPGLFMCSNQPRPGVLAEARSRKTETTLRPAKRPYRSCFKQVRRPDFPVFELFNAAWCVRTPQPRGTQPRLRCSVVGLLRAPPAPRLRFCRGSASCAFPALSPTRFGLLVATKPHTSGGLAALRVPVGEGIAGAKTGVWF